MRELAMATKMARPQPEKKYIQGLPLPPRASAFSLSNPGFARRAYRGVRKASHKEKEDESEPQNIGADDVAFFVTLTISGGYFFDSKSPLVLMYEKYYFDHGYQYHPLRP